MRKPRTPPSTHDDAPATVPAVVSPRRADWSDWSADQERRRVESDIEERRKVIDAAIYPRELAGKIAQDAARTLIPDWKLLRLEHRGVFVKLLRDQPELQQREVRQLDKLLDLIRDNLPTHLQPLMADVLTILELRLTAHEAAAFLVGIETGRALERQHEDAHGRIRSRQQAPRRPIPAATANRLHLVDE